VATDGPFAPPRRRVVEWRVIAILASLALVCLAEFLANLHFNSEIFAWQPHSLDIVNSVDGEVVLLNGHFVRNEGLTNVANTWFFSGGAAAPYLGYELAISRMAAPLFASLFSIVTPDPLSALVTGNVVAWILSAWMGYALGARLFGRQRLGIVLGLLIATCLGYIGTVQGTKAHLIGYSYFLALICVAGWLGVHRRETPRANFAAMGLMNALGAFANSVFFPFSALALVIGLYRRVRPLDIAQVILPPFFAATVLRALLSGLYPGATAIDRTFGTLLRNAAYHGVAVLNWICGQPFRFELATASSVPQVYDQPLGPFAWLPAYAENYALLCGVPFTLLAIVGMLTPRSPVTRLGVALLMVQFVQMFLVQTYWPYQTLAVYAVYTAAFGFLVLTAHGLVLVGDAADRMSIGRVPAAMAGRVGILAMGVLLALLAVFNNQHLLFDRPIEFMRFHTNHSTIFPSDWPFGIEKW